MYDFSDKVAVVTGGGGGLGKAVCLCLARDGASVVVAGRTKEKLVKVGDEVKRNGGRAIAVKVDVSKSTAVKKMVDVAIANFGKIDILMNIAGIDMVGRVVDLTEKEWDLVMETNVKSQFLCCKYVLPHMIRQRSGKIVNMASVAGKTGSAFYRKASG